MDHMMHLDQHHDNLEDQCGNQQEDAARTRSTSVSVSRVVFVLAAVAFLSLVSSSLGRGGAPSGAALPAASRQLLAALCGFVTTKKALFIFSNVIFLFLAADCRCFFSICSTMAPSESDDRPTASQLPPCAVHVVQLQPCASCSGSLYHGSNATSASETCPGERGRREDVPVWSTTPESFRLEGDSSSVNLETVVVVVVVEEPACSRVAQELEKQEIDELNRKFEEFIQSRRIKWIKEEEEAVHCQQV